MTFGYDGHATARLVAEPAKRASKFGRGPFVRDRARVLHSSALRRLAAKTQVVEVGSADFPRTRLTHSLETAQIGRELGDALGCDPDLVDAACLAHDLGHPPFGHNGESALARIAAGCGGFEGNAQSLRLLTRLEAKIPGAGLDLTRATLDATLKYPWLAPATGMPEAHGTAVTAIAVNAAGVAETAGSRDPRPLAPAGVKYGCYAEDAEIFAWIRDGAPPRRPCLEAQVMDWADDIAYSVHDLEDGLHSGLITLEGLRDRAEREQVIKVALADYCPDSSASELDEVFTRMLAREWWPKRFDGGPATTAAVKNLTSELIAWFCAAAIDATRPGGSAPLGRFLANLEVPRQQRLECAVLKAVTAHYVMGRAGAAQVQAREREVLAGLAAALADGTGLDPLFRPDFEAAESDAARLRVVVDQIASLTDTSALAWHAALCR